MLLASPSNSHPFAWAIVPFILGIAVAGSCYVASGVSLGLFFGPVLLITFLAPPLAMGEKTARDRLLVCAMLALGVWLVWLSTANLSIFDAARCGLVLFTYIVALAGAASLLESIHLGRTFAAGMIVLLGIAWLTWPIWLCRWLATAPSAQMIVNWLTAAHPLMAMNAILFNRFYFWDRYTLAYQQLTTLNQDVLYTLPHTVGWMVGWHAIIAATGLSAKGLAAKMRKSTAAGRS